MGQTTRIKIITALIFTFCFSAFFPMNGFSAVPKLISYQGKLTDDLTNPLHGTYDMVFSIYDSPNAVTALWSEEQKVTVTDGIFSVLIGETVSTNPFPNDLFDGQRWLGVAVGADAEMEPRQQLTSTPFAMRAGQADTIDGLDSTDFIATTGGTMTGVLTLPTDGLEAGYNQLVISGGNVGVGTKTPRSTLDVDGDINANGVFNMDGAPFLKKDFFDNSFIGSGAGQNNSGGTKNTFLGESAGNLNTTGSNNTFIGVDAGKNNKDTDNNTFVGYRTGQNNIGLANTFLGSSAGYTNKEGGSNTFLGSSAGVKNQTGNNNTFVGGGSGNNNLTGSFNTFLGRSAGTGNTEGQYNTYMGYQAGHLNENGNNNLFLGYQAAWLNKTGDNNTFLGTSTGYRNEAGNNNTFVGYKAGHYNTNGSDNTFIGYEAGHNSLSGSGNIFIGYKAGYSAAVSNKLYVHNSDTPSPLIYGDFNSKKLEINGNTSVASNLLVDGKVGVGTDTPAYPLDVLGERIRLKYDHPTYGERWIAMRADGGVLDLTYEGGSLGIQSTTDGDHICLNASLTTNKVGIGTWGPTQKLDVNGNARFRSVISTSYHRPLNITEDGTLTTATSDIRLKTNIEPIKDGLNIVSKLQGVRFNWKHEPTGERRIGLIAQNVETVLPELTFINPSDGYKGINYAELSAVLIEAVKTQQKTIDRLQNQLETFEKKKLEEIEILKTQFSKLQKIVYTLIPDRNQASEKKLLASKID